MSYSGMSSFPTDDEVHHFLRRVETTNQFILLLSFVNQTICDIGCQHIDLLIHLAA